jgi:SAM-dependent methyltransferase
MVPLRLRRATAACLSAPSPRGTNSLVKASATLQNEQFYDDFWQSCPDFSRFNPGVLHRRRAILKRLETIPFRSLLDVGCGDAELIVWLRERLAPDIELCGVDVSSETVAKNSARHPYATFHVLNVERARLDRTFDAVVCTEVIEHLDDRQASVQHLAAMVSPGGHLILTCPAGKVHATERHFGHVSHPTPVEIRALCEKSGLRVLSLQNWGFPVYTALKYLTNVNPEWALRSFAQGAYGAKQRAISQALFWANFLNLPNSPVGCQQFLVAERPLAG